MNNEGKTILEVVPWLAEKKGVPTEIIGRVIDETQKAWYFGSTSRGAEWFPKSQCRIRDAVSKKTETNEVSISPGMYEAPDGRIYLVKYNRKKTRVYAKRLVEAPSERITEEKKIVNFDFEYESGAIYRIKPEWRMSLGRAKELVIRYSRCIVCGRRLKTAESVERGIGPVCIKYFGGILGEEVK